MYKEILELYEFCKENGIWCEKEDFLDGYKLSFKNNSDCVQHRGSYGGKAGYVEFGFTYEKIDFEPIKLEDAKKFVLKHKKQLNKEV